MSDESGYVKIPRSAYDTDPFWLERREFSKWEAWEWLVQAASWKPRDWVSEGSMKAIRLERGETPPLSTRYLAGVWGWDKMRVVRFLKMLGDEGMRKIRYSKRDSKGDTYLIEEYDTYSGARDSKRDSERDSSETAARQQRDTKEESKKVRNSLPTEERNTHTRTHVRGTSTRRCPTEWEPKDDHRRLALSLGVDLLSELEFFRDYEFANAHKDWDATFRNWLRKDAKTRARFNGNGKHPEASGEDAGELQRRRQQEMDNAEAEYAAQRAAWKAAIAARWEAEEPEVRNRIRSQAEGEFERLRGDEQRFRRAVDPRTVQLYAQEIHLPPPPKRTL